ncbi:MAG: hypothetical protein JST85_05140, partial [Acidobacteria bacterium]|nr:hypothetical protein [Acidobacteriota bacterium]
ATIEELYVSEYRHASWFVHSGMVGHLNMELEFFQMSCARAFLRCADLGAFCTKIVLKDFALIEHLSDLKDRLDQVNVNRFGFFIERAKQ